MEEQWDFLMETERQLAQDPQGTFRGALMGEFQEEFDRLLAQKRKLQIKDDYLRLEALCCALDQSLMFLASVKS